MVSKKIRCTLHRNFKNYYICIINYKEVYKSSVLKSLVIKSTVPNFGIKIFAFPKTKVQCNCRQ